MMDNNDLAITGKKPKTRHTDEMVCRFWLEHRCKKGDNCEFIHEFIDDKIPECINAGFCNKPDCPFKHNQKPMKECPLYQKGFCKDGKECKFVHTEIKICLNYLLGFCPIGTKCEKAHVTSPIAMNQRTIIYLGR